MKYVWFCVLVVGVMLSIAYGIYAGSPESRDSLLLEDGIVENLSAMFYFFTFVVGSFYIFKSDKYKKTILAVSLLSLLGCLDELSFGERLFNLKMPRISGVQIDGAHDFFSLIARVLDEMPRLNMVIIVALCMVIFSVVMWKYGFQWARRALAFYGIPTSLLFCLFVGQIVLALLIDLEMVRHDILFVLEEQMELTAAITLLFVILSLSRSGEVAHTAPSGGE